MPESQNHFTLLSILFNASDIASSFTIRRWTKDEACVKISFYHEGVVIWIKSHLGNDNPGF